MATESNATVLGVASMAKTLPIVGVVLVVLFVFIKPRRPRDMDSLRGRFSGSCTSAWGSAVLWWPADYCGPR